VVVTNPPYLSRRKMNKELKKLVSNAYPEGKSDLYAAFIQRCLEYAETRGYVGMLTMHSFMFISSYEDLRQDVRSRAAIEAMAHCGPALFDVGNPGTLQTTAFALRKEPDVEARANSMGTYVRLVHEDSGDAKRRALEEALRDLRLTTDD
jgi:type I restriction-modification system DNA methylase subunit